MTERIEGMLNRIPGYTGYRRKESMRDDDRRLREEIARSLSQSTDDLSALGAKLASERRLDLISTVEDAISRVRHLESRVRTASYGYGGIFSDRSVDEHALQQLKDFDLAFQKHVDALNGMVPPAATGDAVDAQAFAGIQQKLVDLNKLFDTRGDVIETATPTRDPDVLALLEEPRVLSPQEAQLLSVRRGGTGAILGDNYQFTAHIALTSRAGDPVLTLVELDGGPDWLAVTDDSTAVQAWRVSGSDSAQDPAGQATAPAGQSGIASVAGPQGTQTDVPATYTITTTGAGEAATIEISLALAGSNRAYRGSNVPLIDLQVFSVSSSS